MSYLGDEIDTNKSSDGGIFQLDDLVDQKSSSLGASTSSSNNSSSKSLSATAAAPLDSDEDAYGGGGAAAAAALAVPPMHAAAAHLASQQQRRRRKQPDDGGGMATQQRRPSLPFVDVITPRVGSVKRSAEIEGFLSAADAADLASVGAASTSAPTHFNSSSGAGGLNSAPVSVNPLPLGAMLLASAGGGDDSGAALPQTKQRRRTRNMDELIDLVPSLLAVANFLKTHTCFEMVPNSGKVVVLEAQISLLDALSAMSENELFSATCWDADKHDFIGLMSPLQLLNSVVHFRNELPPPPSQHDYDASSALAAQLAAAKPPPSSLSKFSTSVEDDGDVFASSPTPPWASSAVALAAPPLPASVRDVADADLSLALRHCTVGGWLSLLSPLRVNLPTPAAPLPSAIGSPLLARRAATRGLCFIDPNDTLWDACRALLGALDSKLPLIDRETQSVLCIVTLSRMLACLYNGLRPLPSLLARSIDLLGVGAFVHTHAGAPRGHVSPRATLAAPPPPSALLGTPLGCALALMAKHHTGSLVLVDPNYRPVTILAAADVPALFRIAVDMPAPPSSSSTPASTPAPVAAPMAEDGVAPDEPSLLSMSCGDAMQHIAARCQRLLTCERSASLATVMQMLVQNRVHQIVLVDDRGIFDGVVSATDVLRFLCKSV